MMNNAQTTQPIVDPTARAAARKAFCAALSSDMSFNDCLDLALAAYVGEKYEFTVEGLRRMADAIEEEQALRNAG